MLNSITVSARGPSARWRGSVGGGGGRIPPVPPVLPVPPVPPGARIRGFEESGEGRPSSRRVTVMHRQVERLGAIA
jgi:hypothetical protein